MSINQFLNKKIRIFLILLITIVIFLVIFSQIDFFSVVGILSRSNIWLLSIMVVLELIAILIKTRRWQIILKSIGCKIPFKECFHVVMATFPLLPITPSKSGDLIKTLYLKGKFPAGKTIGSILTERILDVLFLILLALIGLIFYPITEVLIIIIIILIALFSLFLIQNFRIKLPIKKSWNDKIRDVFSSLKILPKKPNLFFILSVYSIIFWFIAVVQMILLFSALGIDVPLFFIMANIPIAILIGQIPVTLGGMGTRDSAIILLFSEYAKPAELLGVGILFSFFRYWLLALIGIPFMKKYIKFKNKLNLSV